MQADSLQHSSQQTKRATSNHSALTYVLLNPHSHGGRSAQLVTPLKKLLAKNGLHDALLITPTAQAALQMVHALPACSRVIIAGGDGTVHHLSAYYLCAVETTVLAQWAPINSR